MNIKDVLSDRLKDVEGKDELIAQIMNLISEKPDDLDEQIKALIPDEINKEAIINAIRSADKKDESPEDSEVNAVKAQLQSLEQTVAELSSRLEAIESQRAPDNTSDQPNPLHQRGTWNKVFGIEEGKE